MALEGTLNDFSPFDIMELIDFKQKTGLLFVTAPEGETITLGFEKKGLVLAQSSTKKNDLQLGNILVRAGKITEANRDKALEMQKGTLDRLGFIFAREKYCTEKDICESLRIQIKRVFFTLLRWDEGIYIFEPRESIDYFHEFIKPVFVQPLSVKGLMMEGAVMIDEWPMVEKIVKSLDMVFRQLPVKQGIKTIIGNPNAIGYVSVGTAEYDIIQGIPIKILPLQGIDATTTNLTLDKYPLKRALNLVTKTDPQGLALAFIAYAQSSSVNDIIRKQSFVTMPIKGTLNQAMVKQDDKL